MGDVIHSLPAVAALRAAFPTAHIGWLIEERWAELLCAPGTSRRGPRSPQRPLVDEVHTVNLKEWRRSLFSLATLQRAATVWNDVRDVRYDAAIDLQGTIRSAVLARLSGAPLVYGVAEPWESPASQWYSRKVIVRGKHVIEQNISAAASFVRRYADQFEGAVPSPELPRDPAADARISNYLAQHCPAEHGIGEFAILNPGAGWGGKRWPAQRYGEVARSLAAAGISTIVNLGPGEEDLFDTVQAGTACHPERSEGSVYFPISSIDPSPQKTAAQDDKGTTSAGLARSFTGSITDLIALTRRARIFIGGDTGPLHLAAALRVPVVAIYGPTNPARTGPYGTRGIVLRSSESRTTHARTSQPEEGMLSITSAAVIAAAKELVCQ